MFDIVLIFQIIFVIVLAALLYMLVGIIPGTDETSVLVPATAFLFALNTPPLVVLAFFVSAITSLNLTDSIPTALTSIPGGVMSTPLVDHSKHLKERGLVTKSIRKMTTGSFYGTIFGFLVSLLIVLAVYLFQEITKINIAQFAKDYGPYIYLGGAIFLSIISKKKWTSLLVIIPFALAVHLTKDFFSYGIEKMPLLEVFGKKQLSATPFFLAITLGPLLLQIFKYMFPKYRKKKVVHGAMDLHIEKDEKMSKAELKDVFISKETKPTIIASILSSFLFFLSPVGVTMLVGNATTSKIKDKDENALTTVSVMNGIGNATYLSGLLISLFAFGFAISPAAAGPGGALFDEANSFLTAINSNIWVSLLVVIFAFTISLIITMFLTLKYAKKITKLVFKYIPQEAVIALLIGIVVLLVFLDGGILAIVLILLLSLFAGYLNSIGVSYGVLFMSFYASGIINIIIERIG